jgi:hypothetical protein
MNEQKLSEQDRWLIQRWQKARQFEDAMVSARLYYEDLFRKVHQRVRKRYPELNECTPQRLSERVTEAAWEGGGGCAGFSSAKWRRAWTSWPSGIWISNISLDELVTERAPAPTSCIWVSVSKRSDKRVEKLRGRLVAKSLRLAGYRSLGVQKHDESDNRVCLWYQLPGERTRLLKMVLLNDGRPFVDCIVNHVELMARLVQGLDDLLR